MVWAWRTGKRTPKAEQTAATCKTKRNGRGILDLLTVSLTTLAPEVRFENARSSLSGGRCEHCFATLTRPRVHELGGLTDFQQIERVRVVVNVRNRLPGNFDDDVALLEPCLFGRPTADHAAQQQSLPFAGVVR